MGFVFIVAGALSLAMWIKFIVPNREGRHADNVNVPAFGMIAWFFLSLVALFAGYIMLAV